jgi:hypothetical protein
MEETDTVGVGEYDNYGGSDIVVEKIVRKTMSQEVRKTSVG